MTKLLTLKGTTGTPRIETYLDREWTVVPVVALVEGVIYAMNSPGPELVTADVYEHAPEAWNGRPIFIDHPLVDGHPVSGNTPEILEAKAFGQVFNAGTKDSKLVMEAWIDNARASVVEGGQDLLDRVNAEDPIEISVGAFVDVDEAAGTYNGRDYVGRWVEIVPDHLALLPTGVKGACSRDMGCGVRAAKGVVMSEVKKSGGFLSRILTAIRGMQSPSEMSDNDVRSKIGDALRQVDPRAYYPDAVYDAYFVYCVYSGDYSTVKYYRRDYTLAANGDVSVGDPTEVEPVLTYEDVQPEPAAVAALSAPPAPTTKVTGACACGQKPAAPLAASTEEKTMKLSAELTAKLEGATDEQIAAIGKVFEPAPAAVAEPAAAAPVVAAAAAPVAPTFDSLLAAAAPDVRESIQAGIRAAADKKAAAITALKGSGKCVIPDEQLQAMNQGQLDALKTLAGITEPVDFAGLGAPRVPANGATDVPAAPDLAAGIKAARAAK